MNLINWLTSPVAEALGWTLIHSIWQGFAVVLSAALLLHLTRRSRAALRYQLGMGGLLAQVLASAITFGWYYEPRSLTTPGAMGQPGFRTSLLQMTPANESWLLTTQAFLNAHLAEVVWIWLVGVGVFGVRLIGGWAYVQRLKTTATLPVPTILTETTARIAQKLAVSARLQLSARASGPMVVGVLKPVVLWPVGLLAGLSMADVEAILAHELAHVRRHDYLLNVLQSVVEVLYFFHPALWWLSARVREEREHCCDDVAVEIIGDARTLARALARVEEWQRSAEEAPALAMAFASKRQLLLQRVRRMLGVPTRPLVSNGSLAGLTLVTMLLLSVSVYAVGRVEEPKTVPMSVENRTLTLAEKRDELKQILDSLQNRQTNRQHTVDKNTEYGMTNSGLLTYVIWKGQKLPATRVARLQNQLNRVMGGQLNLDAVKQPDRDMLLTIIEKNVAFDAGMKALSEGMAHIDYNNIVADSGPKNEMPIVKIVDSVQLNGKWVKYAEYHQSIDGSVLKRDTSRIRSAQKELEALTKRLQEVMAERQPIIDRLSKEITELTLKNGDWQQAAQFEKQHQAMARQQATLARQQVAMARQQTELAKKMAPLDAELAKLSRQQTAQAKSLMRQKEVQRQRFEKEMDRLGDQMGKLGSQMGDMGKQLEPLEGKLQPYHDRLNLLADSISHLVEPTQELSEKIGELSSEIAEEANEQAEKAMRMAEDAMQAVELNEDGPARALRAPRPPHLARPPRPARAPRAPRPSVYAPPAPAIAPTPAPAPARAPKPAPTPKVAPIPAPAQAPKAPKPPKKEKVGQIPVKIEGSAVALKQMQHLSLTDQKLMGTVKDEMIRLGRIMDANPNLKTGTFKFKDGDKLKDFSVTFTKND